MRYETNNAQKSYLTPDPSPKGRGRATPSVYEIKDLGKYIQRVPQSGTLF